MARANFVSKARKTIYVTGKVVKYPGKVGTKREGTMVTKRDRTIPADKNDKVLIEKGQPYWHWQFKDADVTISPTRPSRSQLTRSGFLSELYDIEDEIGEYAITDIKEADKSVLESQRDEWVSRIEALRDKTQDALDNMPEQLQDTSINRERVDALDSWIDELNGVDIDIEDDDVYEEQARGEWSELSDEDQAEESEDEWVEARMLELKQEAYDEAVNELQSPSSGL